MTRTLLRIDSSARTEGSVSRDLTDKVVARLNADTVITRDLGQPLPLIDADWIGASFTPEAQRDADQAARLALSDELIAELNAADTVVIGVPVYNFGVPAALKAWIDMVTRAGVTFRYTEAGPEGQLKGKRAVLVMASGGTGAGSAADFATPYLKHILGFIGITDVQVVAADSLAIDAEKSLAAANDAVAALKAA